MPSKDNFATQAQMAATSLAQTADKLADIVTVYFDRGYNSGGGDEIIDNDISSLGFTADQLGSLITLAQQFDNFLNNAAVLQDDYDATLNKIRSDV